MKHAIKSMVLGLSLLFVSGSIAYAQDFDAGLAAYENKDYATALNEWRPLAEQGNAYAQFNVGVIYARGQGVTQDYLEAVRLFRLSAEQGDTSAQNNLGAMHGNGEGVIQNKVCPFG